MCLRTWTIIWTSTMAHCLSLIVCHRCIFSSDILTLHFGLRCSCYGCLLWQLLVRKWQLRLCLLVILVPASSLLTLTSLMNTAQVQLYHQLYLQLEQVSVRSEVSSGMHTSGHDLPWLPEVGLSEMMTFSVSSVVAVQPCLFRSDVASGHCRPLLCWTGFNIL